MIRQAGFQLQNIDFMYFEFSSGWLPTPPGIPFNDCTYIPIMYRGVSHRWELGYRNNWFYEVHMHDSPRHKASDYENDVMMRIKNNPRIRNDIYIKDEEVVSWKSYGYNAAMRFIQYSDGFGVFGGYLDKNGGSKNDYHSGFIGRGTVLCLAKRR